MPGDHIRARDATEPIIGEIRQQMHLDDADIAAPAAFAGFSIGQVAFGDEGAKARHIPQPMRFCLWVCAIAQHLAQLIGLGPRIRQRDLVHLADAAEADFLARVTVAEIIGTGPAGAQFQHEAFDIGIKESHQASLRRGVAQARDEVTCQGMRWHGEPWGGGQQGLVLVSAALVIG